MVRNKNRTANLLKWLSLAFLIVASTAAIFIAVSLTPASGKTTNLEAEVLAKQLEFILKMNSAFLAFLGIIGVLLTWFFKNSLEDAKKVAKDIVRQELIERINPLLDHEVRTLEKTLKIEQIIGDTSLHYYLSAVDTQYPAEYNLLTSRGFRTQFFNKIELPKKRLGDVLAIDISNSPENMNYLKTENDSNSQKIAFQKLEDLVDATLDDLISNRSRGRMPVIIVYVRPGKNRIKAIDNLKTDFPSVKYYTSANTPVALMGAAIDSAYVAYGDRSTNS